MTNSVRLRNLTGHPVVLLKSDNMPFVAIEPEGERVRRVETFSVREVVSLADGTQVPITRSVLGPLSRPLPEPEEGVLLITSRIVADHCDREDVLFPAESVITSDGVRGCKYLVRRDPRA